MEEELQELLKIYGTNEIVRKILAENVEERKDVTGENYSKSLNETEEVRISKGKADVAKGTVNDAGDAGVAALDKQQKAAIVHALVLHQRYTVSCPLDMNIFHVFPAKQWAKEILIYTLMSMNETWNPDQVFELQKAVNKFTDIIKTNSEITCTLEDVLIMFINTQRTCSIDMDFIIMIINLLVNNVEYLNNITSSSVFSFSMVNNLKTGKVKADLDKLKIQYTEEELNELQQLKTIYSNKAIENFFDNLSTNTAMIKILKLFRLLHECEEIMSFEERDRFLCSLSAIENLDEWIYNLLYKYIIEKLINDQFYHYSYELVPNQLVNVIGSCLKNENLVSTTYSECDDEKKAAIQNYIEEYKIQKLNSILNEFHIIVAKIVVNVGLSKEMIEFIKNIIGSFDDEYKICQMSKALLIILDYEIKINDSSDGITLEEVVYLSNPENISKKVHDFVVSFSFSGSFQLTLNQLVDEIVSLNHSDHNIWLSKADISLKSQVENIKKIFVSAVSTSNKFSTSIIQDWSSNDIKSWSRKVKHIKNTHGMVSDDEIIAVMIRAVEISKGFKIRDVQLLSIIMLIKDIDNKGRLAQIQTGEGKTVIVAMVAIYYVLKGKTVDVITSSPVLSITQSIEFKEFFSLFGISVSHNHNNNIAYISDIIYGYWLDFEGDILQDEFYNNKIRAGRQCDIAIIDEVDNMFIDGINNIVKLAAAMPGMDNLEVLLAAIYSQVNNVASMLIERNGQLYYQDSESNINSDNIFEKEVHEYSIDITKEEFIKKCTEEHVRKLIRDPNVTNIEKDYPEIKVPKHLWDFVIKVQLKNWIDSAIQAKFNYTINRHYIVRDNQIKIVDVSNTGVIEENSQWNDGLHQFLQLKHGLKIDPEGLTSTFMSNVSFYRRYNRLYGVTGTLGSKVAKELLIQTYNVDTLIIPSFKKKQHKELVPIIVTSKIKWYIEVVKSCLNKLNNGRAVLVIMAYIEDTINLESVFADQFGYEHSKIKLLKSDSDISVTKNPLEPGEIIIATNIAGRGTDIKVSKVVEENGGLHVCVAHLPKNSRVENQNIGRTSRNGNRGTSQFVLINYDDINIMRGVRNENERVELQYMKREMKSVILKDDMFKKFSDVIKIYRQHNKHRIITIQNFEIQAALERFALWIKINDTDIESEVDINHVMRKYDAFINKLTEYVQTNNVIENPYFHIKIGNIYLKNGHYDEAIIRYNLAISLDANFAEHAYYNRACAFVAMNREDYAKKAIEDFKMARKLIKDRETYVMLVQQAAEGDILSHQAIHKVNLYSMQKNAIDYAIGADDEAIIKEINSLKINERKQSDKEVKKKINERIMELNKRKGKHGIIKEALDTNSDMKIKLWKFEEQLPADDYKSHYEEIEELITNGAVGTFQITLKPKPKPISWGSVIGLFFLGLAQIVVGTALIVFTGGIGSTIGAGLIAEGVSDIIYTVKEGIINRNFDWKTWAIEKSVSLIVSIACAGVGTIKNVAKGIVSLGKGITSFAIKRVTTQTAKEGFKIAIKKVGYELGKGIAIDLTNELINYEIDNTIYPIVQEKLFNQAISSIKEALSHNADIKQLLLTDLSNNNKLYENLIFAVGDKLLLEEDSSLLQNIANEIVTRIADNKVKGFMIIRLTGEISSAVNKLNIYISEFIKNMIAEIKLQVKNDNSYITKVLEEINKHSAKIYSNNPENEYVLSKQEEQKRINTIINTMSNNFADKATQNMMNIIKNKIVNPVAAKAIQHSIDKVTSGITNKLEHIRKTFATQVTVINGQNVGLGTQPSKIINDKEMSKNLLAVDELIQKTRTDGPMGLPHLGAISDVVNAPIKVYDEKQRLLYTIGDTKKTKPVSIQFYKPKDEGRIGHYTLLGGKEPKKNLGENMCLVNVIGAQIGFDPYDLKRKSLNLMEERKYVVAKHIEQIHYLDIYSHLKLNIGGASFKAVNPNETKRIIDDSEGVSGAGHPNPGHPRGHASHRGSDKFILEAIAESTETTLIIHNEKGNIVEKITPKKKTFKEIALKRLTEEGDDSKHKYTTLKGEIKPNNLRSDDFYDIISKKINIPKNILFEKVQKQINSKQVPLNESSVENYSSSFLHTITKGTNKNVMKISKTTTKTGFLSKEDQDAILYHSMQTKQAKEALDTLNEYYDGTNNPDHLRKVITVSMEDMMLKEKMFASEWIEGQPTSSVFPIQEVKVILQHHAGHELDKDYPVHVQTIFPLKPKK